MKRSALQISEETMCQATFLFLLPRPCTGRPGFGRCPFWLDLNAKRIFFHSLLITPSGWMLLLLKVKSEWKDRLSLFWVKADSGEKDLGKEKLMSLSLEAGLSAGQQVVEAVTGFSAPTPVFFHCCRVPINLESWALFGWQIVECNWHIQKPTLRSVSSCCDFFPA